VPDQHFRQQAEAAYLCECGASLCDERVPMSVWDYDASLEPVLANEHGPQANGPEKCVLCGRPYLPQRRNELDRDVERLRTRVAGRVGRDASHRRRLNEEEGA
jgi:hypothetical protein